MTDTNLGIDEGLHDTGPCPCHVMAIVSSAARADDASLAVFVGEPAQRRRRVRMRLFCPAQVGNRIALKTVGTALHQNELRLLRVDVGLNLLPRPAEFSIVCPRSHRNIQFCSLRPAFAGFVRMAGSRVQVASILVDIREDQVGVVLKSVKDTVAVVSVDIDIGDTPQPVFHAQVFGRDTAIVEHTKPGGTIASRVMESGNRNKRTLVVVMHDFIDSA